LFFALAQPWLLQARHHPGRTLDLSNALKKNRLYRVQDAFDEKVPDISELLRNAVVN